MAVTLGGAGSTGVGGLMPQGGHGLLERTTGLSVDSMLEVSKERGWVGKDVCGCFNVFVGQSVDNILEVSKWCWVGKDVCGCFSAQVCLLATRCKHQYAGIFGKSHMV